MMDMSKDDATIRRDAVVLNNLPLYRISSSTNHKVQCKQDGNIYQIAYIPRTSFLTFKDTDILIDSSASKEVTVDNIVNFKQNVLEIIEDNNDFVADVIDGVKGNGFVVDAGGAN